MHRHLLVSDADHFRVADEINPWMDRTDQPDPAGARAEHDALVAAHRDAGRTVERVASAPDCPDMVFTANAALVRGERAVLGRPPAARAGEIAHHRAWLEGRGFTVDDPPAAFSGQGDALPVLGDVLLAGHGQRTDPAVHPVLAERLDYEVVPLRTSSALFYDLDLAVGVVDPDRLLAWCPEALDGPSRRRVRALRGRGLELVEVAPHEAQRFALNLVGDGTTVTLTRGCPRLAGALRARGLVVHELVTTELAKSGGGVRCTALTLDAPAPVPGEAAA
ncbi:dimethylarginine dimethylaminohydrolase family protein [Actinomycetospora cinnamomea]|uniref:N-dimethylarginine dimethylaminohydrolase n=1 Tax=Actinomycetospora cinnamomea TaxID=663609 RepID=A0A2U1FLV0_9PSEU|nr:arginine deiminase-related protein [Actinomycetospora cinnamomea]PVZ13154.1 N-dimethylarginine dimethylaminohydrolase [Actinomycetospora cinnamomea]